ncbi:MAG: HD domain-containing phosphohydrolase [Burkholderiales bacterium]
MLEGADLDNALEVAADFIDLKSPYMTGHSRRCARLSADAARLLGLTEEAITTLRRAALVHDFGTTAVPSSIWDKTGPLTRAEFDRIELHPMLTEQMLRRSPALATLSPLACAHHEKADGSGYHKRLRTDSADSGACLRKPPGAASRWALPSRGRGAPPRSERTHDQTDRRPALHLAEDCRPPHPAHLHEDRGIDSRRHCPVGDATRRRSLSCESVTACVNRVTGFRSKESLALEFLRGLDWGG